MVISNSGCNILPSLVVPAQNSVNNVNIIDVVGNKTDDESGTSLMSGNYIIGRHFHSPAYVSPSLANGIVLTGGVGAWQLGNFSADIIAAGAIGSPYDVHFVNISTASVADTYEIHFFYGASDTFAGSCRFTRAAAATADVSPFPVMTPIIPAGSRFRAKVASSSGGGDTCTLSLIYHIY